MGREEIEQEKMDRICESHDWPQVPFDAYVTVRAVVDGTAGLNKIRGTVQSVFRDWPRDGFGGIMGDTIDTFAKVRLDVPLPGVKRGRMIETLNMVHHSSIEPIGPLDLMIEGISI